jgi:hypothetical protein
MSTKVTIKHRYPVANRPGFHLYDDVFDDFGDDPDIETPVYLKLEGVAVELRTRGPEGDWVTLTIPRELARELGLVPPLPNRPPRANAPAHPPADFEG